MVGKDYYIFGISIMLVRFFGSGVPWADGLAVDLDV